MGHLRVMLVMELDELRGAPDVVFPAPTHANVLDTTRAENRPIKNRAAVGRTGPGSVRFRKIGGIQATFRRAVRQAVHPAFIWRS
jgi:hypothetical protein